MRPETARLLFAAALVTTGCTALLDVKDIYFDPDAPAPNADGGADAVAEGGATDGGADATCDADLQSDPKNCGRCGRDCLGSACVAGRCEPVVLAAGLGNPTGLTLSGPDVYVTAQRDGTVLQIPKAGGAPKVLASGQEDVHGVVVDGVTLYWSNGDFRFNDAGAVGGIWKCTLPGCAAPTLVTPGDIAMNVELSNGFLYYAARNDAEVRRVTPSGAGDMLVAATNSPFDIAVDGTHVYYTSSQPSLYRALIDGGSVPNEEAVGPLDSKLVGYVTVDDQRYYWAYVDQADKGHVLSGSKAAPASPKTSYGSEADNVGAIGVAVDATYLYWSTDGTATGNVPDANGKLFACPKQGCGPQGPILLADQLVFGGPIATDDQAVYWVEFGSVGQANGRLRKVAKP